MVNNQTMNILVLKTNQPEAELYLYIGVKKRSGIKWQAHLRLAETLNLKVKEILNKSSISADNLDGLVIYKGPGSFTGLRIGLSVFNALAYAYSIPIISSSGENWVAEGINKILMGENEYISMPDYGQPAKTTKQLK